MSWFDAVTNTLSNSLDVAVQSGTDFLGASLITSLGGVIPEPEVAGFASPSVATQPTTAATATAPTGLAAGLGGFSWQTLAAIATVVGLFFMMSRRK